MDSKIQRSTDKCVFATANQMVRWLLPASDYSRACGNQIVEYSSDNLLESWEEPPNIWLTVAKNAFVGWALNFGVCMLLKGAVMWKWKSAFCLQDDSTKSFRLYKDWSRFGCKSEVIWICFSFNWDTFSQMTRLDQSCASKNILWIIKCNILELCC